MAMRLNEIQANRAKVVMELRLPYKQGSTRGRECLPPKW